MAKTRTFLAVKQKGQGTLSQFDLRQPGLTGTSVMCPDSSSSITQFIETERRWKETGLTLEAL